MRFLLVLLLSSNLFSSNIDVTAPSLSDSSSNAATTAWVKALATSEGWGTGGSTVAEENVFNVVDEGADPTGQTSSQQAFQSAFTKAKAVNLGAGYGSWNAQRSGVVFIPKGAYTGISTFDGTNCVGLVIRGQGPWGTSIYANGQTTPAPVFDFSQSSYCHIENLTIHGQNPDGSCPSVMPMTAVLFADTAQYAGSSNKNTMRNVNIYGYFSSASLSVYRSTNNNFYDCAVHNDYIYAPALYVGKNNYRGLSSQFRTLASAGFVANENAFFGCEFHGAKTSSCWYGTLCIDGANTFQMFGGICDGNGNGQPIVYFPNNSSDIFFSGTKFYTENGTPPICVFYNDVSVNRLICIGTVKDSSISSSATTYGSGSWPNLNLNGM